MSFDFMKDWDKKKPDVRKLSRHAVHNDRYDREDVQRLLQQMEDFKLNREKLTESKAGELGYDIWQDLYLEFWKVAPELFDPNEVRPSHLVNRVVAEEATDLTDFKELRQWTQGDDISSALACVAIEPDVETLYDKLEEEIKQAQELQQLMEQVGAAEDQQRSEEEMFQDWTNQEEGEREPIDWNARLQAGQDALDQLKAQAEAAGQSLQEALENARPEIRAQMSGAMRRANADMDNQSQMAETWGMEPGQLTRLPAQQRMELAKRMNTPKFKRLAQLFGPMKRVAFTEQRRKVNHAPEEIFDVETGNNLSRVLPEQLMKIRDRRTRRLFFKDFVEKNLLQYKMRGKEKVGKGGIIYCHDGSGSMGGEKEIWAKAVGLALLHIAKKQKRAFWGIQFGSANQIRVDDFSEPGPIKPELVLDFAEYFFNGGTDFQSPLNKALQLLNEENDRTGAIKSDIVFATDGMCGVSDEWMKNFKEEQKRLGFVVWGIIIGGGYGDEPLNSICDGRVATISSLTNGENVRQIFGGI